MKKIVVALLVAVPVIAFGETNGGDKVKLRNPNDDPVIVAPDSFDLHKTYFVVEGKGWTGVQPYSDAKDCERLAAHQGSKCITGAEAKARFDSK